MSENPEEHINQARAAWPHITPLITDWRALEDQGGDPHHARQETAAILTATEKIIPLRYQDADATDPAILTWINDLIESCTKSRVSRVPRLGSGPSVLILGPTGTGKTHQGYGALRRLSLLGVNASASATTAPDFYAQLRPRPSIDPEQEFKDHARARLLFVDDLGAAKNSEWVEEINTRLVNHRYDHGLPTIFTSNVPPKELGEKLGERVASRLTQMCRLVVLKGHDRRLQERAA